MSGITTCVHHVTTKRQSVKREMDQSGLFIKQIQKKFPIIILELKKCLSYKTARHFTYSAFLEDPRPSLLIDSEPERPVPRETLAPCDKLGLPSIWGVSVGTHMCLRTCISSLTFHLALVSLMEGLWARRRMLGRQGMWYGEEGGLEAGVHVPRMTFSLGEH